MLASCVFGILRFKYQYYNGTKFTIEDSIGDLT